MVGDDGARPDRLRCGSCVACRTRRARARAAAGLMPASSSSPCGPPGRPGPHVLNSWPGRGQNQDALWQPSHSANKIRSSSYCRALAAIGAPAASRGRAHPTQTTGCCINVARHRRHAKRRAAHSAVKVGCGARTSRCSQASPARQASSRWAWIRAVSAGPGAAACRMSPCPATIRVRSAAAARRWSSKATRCGLGARDAPSGPFTASTRRARSDRASCHACPPGGRPRCLLAPGRVSATTGRAPGPPREHWRTGTSALLVRQPPIVV